MAAGFSVYLPLAWFAGGDVAGALGRTGLLLIRDVLIGVLLSLLILQVLRLARRRAPKHLEWALVGVLVAAELFSRSGTAARQAGAAIHSLVNSAGIAGPSSQAASAQAPASHPGRAAVDRWLAGYLARAQQIHADMEAAFQQYAVSDFLAPDTFASAQTMFAARRNAVDLAAELETFQARYGQLVDGGAAELEALELPGDMKAALVQEYRQGVPRTKELLQEFFGVEQAFLAQVESFIDFMSDLYGRNGYDVQGGQILFWSEPDLAAYNRRVQDLQALGEQEQRLLEAMQRQVRDQAGSLPNSE